jgi:hypothetical protein
MVRTQGGPSSNPRVFAFLEFQLGNTAATSVTLSIKTAGGTNGTRFGGGHIFAKAFSFDQTTLTYSNSFLGAMPGGTVSHADVSSYIVGQGWTHLGPSHGTDALFELAQGTASTVYDTSGLADFQTDLLNFHNANLGSTISFLFVPSHPMNGNNLNWRDLENLDIPARLTVEEVPEPAAVVLLAIGAMLVRPRRKAC